MANRPHDWRDVSAEAGRQCRQCGQVSAGPEPLTHCPGIASGTPVVVKRGPYAGRTGIVRFVRGNYLRVEWDASRTVTAAHLGNIGPALPQAAA